ncbi:hypothetical protein [Dysgonomonas sp. 520]|uniref:hypothetical protein n=1 Tax=Dysgonomonas sp. 520 TaxID=2302931 RepID=UPI0013D0A211|nr:hypothetical protein [Dysgonomonas sp. 520]NDW09501.1 hypothetical protein [Dysgonomonas sp. 520]
MHITTQTKYKDFLSMLDTFNTGDEEMQAILDSVKDLPLKDEFNLDFNELLFGQLCQLQSMQTVGDLFIRSFWILLKIEEENLMKEKAADCLRFVWHVKEGLERITKLFEAIRHKPTPEEIQAGIGKMDHGFFGTADWYARRMGITDHEEVFQTNWMRIYQAMKIDHDNNQFQENYRKLMERKAKHK